MNHLTPLKPNVYCLRFDKPFAVTPQQFQEWNSDNHSCEMITKEEYLELCKIQLEERKDTIRRQKMLHPIFQEIFTPFIFNK
jgi:hypothetical protein